MTSTSTPSTIPFEVIIRGGEVDRTVVIDVPPNRTIADTLRAALVAAELPAEWYDERDDLVYDWHRYNRDELAAPAPEPRPASDYRHAVTNDVVGLTVDDHELGECILDDEEPLPVVGDLVVVHSRGRRRAVEVTKVGRKRVTVTYVSPTAASEGIERVNAWLTTAELDRRLAECSKGVATFSEPAPENGSPAQRERVLDYWTNALADTEELIDLRDRYRATSDDALMVELIRRATTSTSKAVAFEDVYRLVTPAPAPEVDRETVLRAREAELVERHLAHDPEGLAHRELDRVRDELAAIRRAAR